MAYGVLPRARESRGAEARRNRGGPRGKACRGRAELNGGVTHSSSSGGDCHTIVLGPASCAAGEALGAFDGSGLDAAGAAASARMSS
eukprot:5362554-Prymnesium_polylepis.1